MGNTSLTVGSYTFVFNTSDIEKVDETIQSEHSNDAIASQGPMGAYNYDFAGTQKTVQISGVLTDSATTRVSGYTVTTILAQKQWLESLINGQQDAITLVDDYASQSVLQKSGATPPYNAAFTSTQAMAAMIKFWRTRGEPNIMNFQITLNVGQAVS